MVNKMLGFLKEGVTAFNAAAVIVRELKENGYTELHENSEFNVEKGGKYYVTRNNSSVLAFNIGSNLSDPGAMITASHTDCPSFKLKPNALIVSKEGVRLNVEAYGGPLWHPWVDRPLGLAGRVIIDDGTEIRSAVFNSDGPFCMMTSVAIHMNREANSGEKLNPQIDLLPLVSLDKDFDLNAYLAEKLGVEKEMVAGFDLYVYPCEEPMVWGAKKEFVSSQHLDDLECAYTTLMGFINNFNDDNINIYAAFDNEEVGSLTRQGVSGDFYKNTLSRICKALDVDMNRLLSNSMMLSCDNAHAAHPNHPEKADQTNRPYMNEGIVIKYNANQSYTSDSLSCAVFRNMLNRIGVPYQMFANRSDMRGGSTLGNLANAHVSVLSLDIGLAQLAMHSCYETAGVKDVEYMIEGVKEFYSHHLSLENDGTFRIS